MLACGEGEYGGTDRDQIVTMLRTVMALLCIPLSELVSFAFSTIPIPFKEFSIYLYCKKVGHTTNESYMQHNTILITAVKMVVLAYLYTCTYRDSISKEFKAFIT